MTTGTVEGGELRIEFSTVLSRCEKKEKKDDLSERQSSPVGTRGEMTGEETSMFGDEKSRWKSGHENR